MNPYTPPDSKPEAASKSADAVESSIAPSPNRIGFRYRLIPATLCYLIAGLILAALPFGIYANLDSDLIAIDFRAPVPYVLHDVLFLCAPVVFAIAGVLLLVAGRNWYRGKWWPAAWFTFAAFALTQAFTFSLDCVETWRGNIY